MKKLNQTKLQLRKETLTPLQLVTGGRIISYYNTVPIDDTVYPEPKQKLSDGCGWA
jgi:hypothetical protein